MVLTRGDDQVLEVVYHHRSSRVVSLPWGVPIAEVVTTLAADLQRCCGARQQLSRHVRLAEHGGGFGEQDTPSSCHDDSGLRCKEKAMSYRSSGLRHPAQFVARAGKKKILWEVCQVLQMTHQELMWIIVTATSSDVSMHQIPNNLPQLTPLDRFMCGMREIMRGDLVWKPWRSQSNPRQTE